ncbi:Beta-hydroxyacyl-ACP dehydratase [Planctomycetales bacterium 10988]|nr:Beta-hydroxyacyl-ACP dehydratase [Planctomycetales bacterium 10988]
MRWIWIDKFIEFQPGVRAKAIKNVSLAEEHLHDHYPGYPNMPNSLITEGIAQTGGVLVGETTQFTKRVVLAKIPKVSFYRPVVAGETLTYTVEIEMLMDEGAMVSATSQVDGELQAELEMVYAYLGDEHVNPNLFQPQDFLLHLRQLGLFDRLPNLEELGWNDWPGLQSAEEVSWKNGKHHAS